MLSRVQADVISAQARGVDVVVVVGGLQRDAGERVWCCESGAVGGRGERDEELRR